VFANPGEIPVLLKSLETTVGELDVSMEESVLFAERKIVVDLRDHIEFLQELIMLIKDSDERSEPSRISETAGDLARSFRELSFSLSQSVRKQLDLDDISPDDLKTELDKAREADQKPT